MKRVFLLAEAYSLEKARCEAMAVVDIRAEQAQVAGCYKNQVLFDVNTERMRPSVFDGECRWITIRIQMGSSWSLRER